MAGHIEECDTHHATEVTLKSLLPVTLKEKDGCIMLNNGDMIHYENEAQVFSAMVLNRGGKVTSKVLKNRFNVLQDGVGMRIFLNEVENLEVECSEKMVIASEDEDVFAVISDRREDPEIKEAKNAELENLKSFDSYEEVKDSGQQTVSSRWIITEKIKGEKKVFKARLVCRGFEQAAEFDDIEVTSPTVDTKSKRLFLVICGIFRWQIRSYDVRAAFLQSEDIDRTVYVKPPRDVKKQGIIWRLKKPLYGLNDSCRNWFFSLKKCLLELGLEVTKFDKALFLFRLDNKLQGIVGCHVDDLIFAGTMKFLTLMKEMAKKFVLSKSEAGALRYVGIDLDSVDGEIVLAQKSYSIECSYEHLTRNLDDETVLENELKTLYQSIVGKLNWVSCNSRPDLKFDVFRLSSCKEPRVKDLKAAKKTVRRYHNHGPKFIVYPKLDVLKLEVILFSDASLGNLEEKVKSCMGYIVFVTDGTRCAPVSWNSKKIDRVCSSTLEAESYALNYGLKYGEGVRDDLCDLLGYSTADVPLRCYVDNKTLWKMCYTANNVEDPTLKRMIYKVEQKISEGTVMRIDFVKSKDMLADILTKSERIDSVKFAAVLESGQLKFGATE